MQYESCELRAFCYLAGEMSNSEQEQYEALLLEDADEHVCYQEIARLLVAWETPLESQRTVSSGVGAVRSSAAMGQRGLRATRLFPHAALLLLVFGAGLLTGRWTSHPQTESAMDAGGIIGHQTPPRAGETRRAMEAMIASAWFDLQEDEPTDSIYGSILQEIDLAETRDTTLRELSRELNEDYVPDWLVTAIELKQERRGIPPTPETGGIETLDPAGESL